PPHRPPPRTSLRRNSGNRAEILRRRFHSAARLREKQPAHQPEPLRLEARLTETAAAQIQWSNRAPRSQPPAIPSSQSLMRTPPANCRADSSIQPLRGASTRVPAAYTRSRWSTPLRAAIQFQTPTPIARAGRRSFPPANWPPSFQHVNAGPRDPPPPTALQPA